MTTTLDSSVLPRRPGLGRVTVVAFVAAAVTFNLGGALHPNDNGTGGKVAQLHEMLLDHTWYAAHLLLLASFALFSLVLLRLPTELTPRPVTRRVIGIMGLVSMLTTAAMIPHLLAPLGATSIADGQPNLLSAFITLDETLADAPWALGVAVLALIGGVTGDLGNRATALLGVVGGVCFALAAVTIPFTDALDGLFPIGGMGVTLWAVGAALAGAWRRHQDVEAGKATRDPGMETAPW